MIQGLLARAKLTSSNLSDAAEALADVLAVDPQRRISSLNQYLDACRARSPAASPRVSTASSGNSSLIEAGMGHAGPSGGF